jgi:hypothetical protein
MAVALAHEQYTSHELLLSRGVWKCENYINGFVLKNTFIKVYICYFLINM